MVTETAGRLWAKSVGKFLRWVQQRRLKTVSHLRPPPQVVMLALEGSPSIESSSVAVAEPSTKELPAALVQREKRNRLLDSARGRGRLPALGSDLEVSLLVLLLADALHEQ